MASLFVSALSLALPTSLGPIGPLIAGVLAFVGHRRVRASKGTERGPVLAKVAMTLALVLLVFQAWMMVRHASTAAGWTILREHAARVDAGLRTGTPEGAWELLSADARAKGDRVAFTANLREAMARLGSLESLGEASGSGGDWERTGTFEVGDAADLRLPMVFEARFARGLGRVAIEVVLRRRGRTVTGDLVSLRVSPLGP